MASWRWLTPADLPAVIGIAAAVHPAHPEDDAVLAERLALAPEGCLLLADADGNASGYLLSHPWPLDAAPALNVLLGAVPLRAANWYIHDIALLPEARGSGAAAAAVKAVERVASSQGAGTVALVAVAGSAGFWRRQGFAERRVPELDRKLASYDDAARYMVKILAPRTGAPIGDHDVG